MWYLDYISFIRNGSNIDERMRAISHIEYPSIFSGYSIFHMSEASSHAKSGFLTGFAAKCDLKSLAINMIEYMYSMYVCMYECTTQHAWHDLWQLPFNKTTRNEKYTCRIRRYLHSRSCITLATTANEKQAENQLDHINLEFESHHLCVFDVHFFKFSFCIWHQSYGINSSHRHDEHKIFIHRFIGITVLLSLHYASWLKIEYNRQAVELISSIFITKRQQSSRFTVCHLIYYMQASSSC